MLPNVFSNMHVTINQTKPRKGKTKPPTTRGPNSRKQLLLHRFSTDLFGNCLPRPDKHRLGPPPEYKPSLDQVKSDGVEPEELEEEDLLICCLTVLSFSFVLARSCEVGFISSLLLEISD
jgi:hypothetical protein